MFFVTLLSLSYNYNNEYYEVKELVIPNTITSIGNYQFSGFTNLERIIKLHDCKNEIQHLLINIAPKYEDEYEAALEYEKDLYKKGIKLIAGVDEVGRGPLIGPVVACCCVLPKDFKLEGLNDSKKLTEKKREEFFDEVYKRHPNINYHGLGVTAKVLVEKYNWCSVDSTTWLNPFKNKVITTIEGKSRKSDIQDSYERFYASLEYFHYLNNLNRE